MTVSRSGQVFARLQAVGEHYPHLRPAQILQMVVGPNDPFYWEETEWEARILHAFPIQGGA